MASNQHAGNLVLDACQLARKLHAGQVRRESGRSFFDAHLEKVAGLVGNYTNNDYAIAAAYLHDAIEDVGEHTGEQIAALCPEVLVIVEQLTERGETWEEEKQGYVKAVAQMDWRALLISICDKTCNARDFIDEWKQGKFGKRPTQIIWFFNALQKAYGERDMELGGGGKNKALLWDLSALVGEMQGLHE